MQAKITGKSLPVLIKEAGGKATSSGKAKGTYIWDTELSGFGVYLTPKGDISWLVQKWVGGRGGKAVRQVIGRAKDGMELTEARSLAAANIGEIHKGVDLADKKRKLRQSIREDLQAIKVKDALDRYLEAHTVAGPKSRYRDEMERNLRSSLERFYKTPLRTVSKADVRSMIDAKKGQGARRNLFSAIRPFFNWCLEHDLLTISPVANLTPPSPVKSRDRLLSKEEIKALWTASYHMPDRWGHFYRLLLLTGQRREEVAGMHSSEIDYGKAVWTIPAERAKNGKAHMVHLSGLALAELTGSQGYGSTNLEGAKGSYIFPASRIRLKAEKPEAHISGYSKMKKKLDEQMAKELAKEEIQFSPWRVHDLRRTLASHLAENGVPTDVVDRLLNHVSGSQSGVKGVYQRYTFLKERQQALEDWSVFIRVTTSQKTSED